MRAHDRKSPRPAPLTAPRLSARSASALAALGLWAALLSPEAQAQSASDESIATPGLIGPLAEGAPGVRTNPATLLMVEGTQSYVLATATQLTPTLELRDEAFGSSSASDGGAFSFDMRFIEAPGLGRERQTSTSFAFGAAPFAMGATARWHNASDPRLNDEMSFDFGVMSRPTSYLSLSAAAQQLWHPALTPHYTAGLGLSFFDQRLRVGAEHRWAEGEDPLKGQGELTVASRVRAFEGLDLFGQVALGLDGSVGGATLGLSASLGHMAVGGGAAVAGTSGGYYSYFSFTDRLQPTVLTIPSTLSLDLSEALSAKAGPVPFVPSETRDPYLQLLSWLRRVEHNPHVSGLFIRVRGGEGLSMAQVEELRGAIHRVRALRKQVVFYLDGADDALYYLALSGDEIVAAPSGIFLINGLASSHTFIGKGLNELGVKAEFVRVGEYKHAPDLFLREDLSESQRQVSTDLSADLSARYIQAVSAAREIEAKAFEGTLERGILTAAEAHEAGLIDRVAFLDEVAPEAIGETPRLSKLESAERPWGVRPVIAVVPVVGNISQGASGDGALGQAAGADTVIAAIERAAKDPTVKAIVLRIDSPGGDAHASDMIWRAVRLAREKKPVIASLGSVAASGGYYIASACDRVVANPSTITGSIGIFAGHFDLSALLERFGVHTETLSAHGKADLLGMTHAWSEDERAQMQRFVDAGYALFLDRVTVGRGLEREAVDAVGQGRVWTGSQALEIGLVDELGALEQAITRARLLAKVRPGEEVEISFSRPRRSNPGFGAQAALPPDLAALTQRLQGRAALLVSGRPLALLPWELEIR